MVDCLSDVCPRSDMNSLVGQRLSECSGKGACNRLAAECECQEGYTGEACDSCADGYTMDARDCTQKNPTADYSVAATTSSAAKSLDVEDITASNKPAGWAVAVVCVLGSLIVISFAASVYIWATTRTQDRASPRQESRTSRWSDISKTIEVSIPDGCVDAMDVESRYGRHQGGSFHGWLGKEAEIMAAPTINSTARCMSSPERAAVMQLEGLLTGSRPSPKKSLPEEEAPPKAPEVHASRHSVPLSGVLQHSNERSTLDRLQDVSQHIDCSDAFPVMRHSEDAAALPVEMAEFGQAPDRQSDMPRPVWQRARSDTGKTRSEHTMKRSVPSPASLYAAEPMEMMEPELQAPAALRSGSPGAAKLMTGDSYPMAADLRGEPHGGCEGMLDAAALLSCRALATVSETDMGAGGTARAAPSRSHHADAQPGSSGELSVLLDPPETLDISVSMGVRGAPVRDVRMTRASAWGSNPEEPEPKASLEILCSAKMLSAMLSAEAAVPQQQPLRAEHRAFPRGDEEQSLEIEDRPSSPDSQTSYFSTESYSDVRCNPKELKKHSSSTGSLSARHGSPLNDEEAMSRAFLSAQTSGRRGSAPQQDVGLWIDG